jgi:hypothetical protein
MGTPLVFRDVRELCDLLGGLGWNAAIAEFAGGAGAVTKSCAPTIAG